MRAPWLLPVLFFLLFVPAQAGHSPPKIFLRVHIQTAGDGMSSQETTTIAIPPNGERILIRSLPEITENDLADVQQDPSGTIRLIFNHHGQIALNAVTGENQGRILVVLIDGYVVYAPTIDEQINSGELDIPHQLNPQVMQLLQETAKKNNQQAART